MRPNSAPSLLTSLVDSVEKRQATFVFEHQSCDLE